MNKIKFIHQTVIYIFVTVILLGCTSSSITATPVAATITSVNIVETSTATPSPSPTLMNTHTPTVAPPANPRPLPTQGELTDEEFIRLLRETNGGCELPCFLGIIPGDTSWDATEQFFLDLSLKIEVISDETVTEAGGTSPRRREFNIYGDVNDTESHIFRLWARDNLVTGIDVSRPLTEYHFLLKNLLRNQGVPNKIFVFTHSNVMEPPTAFRLILYYKEHRFLALYSTLVYKENEQITACLDDVGPRILIFPDKKDLTDQQIQEILLGADPRGILSVEDALGISPTVFHETYSNSETSCLVTPAEIWP